MKTVFILRHAKADRDDADGSDFERTLNERGRESALDMGRYFSSKKYSCAAVLCSSAFRTKQTYELFKEGAGLRAGVEFNEALYLADIKVLFARIQAVDDALDSVMVIGHNPGLEQLANVLSGPAQDEISHGRQKRMKEKFSTCAFAVIELPVSHWNDVKAGRGKLVDFMRPRDF